MVDEANNAVQFDKMQICLSGNYKCDKYFQSLIFHLTEEHATDKSLIPIPSAKMNDMTKKDEAICYYLSGPDRAHFRLQSDIRLLQANAVLDRESKAAYQVFITASEYCNCSTVGGQLKEECLFLDNPFRLTDVTQLKLDILLDDINDNVPGFERGEYRVGITSDVEFNQVVLESYVFDKDIGDNLTIGVDYSAFAYNLQDDGEKTNDVVYNKEYFPFVVESLEPELGPINKVKFQIRMHKYLRNQDFILPQWNKSQEGDLYNKDKR